MKKSNIVIFCAFAVVLMLVVPFWAISEEGGADASPNTVEEGDEDARQLFIANCGTCHTLEAAGTFGVVGPNLDELLGVGTPEGNYDRVLAAIENGVQGRMPARILAGESADEVADYVSRVAGQ